MTGTVDLGGQQPPWPDAARRLWAGCLAEAGADPALLRAPAYGGDERLRVALAARYDLDPDRLTVVGGVRAAALALADAHQRVVLHTPGFLGVEPQFAGRAQVARLARLTEPLAPGDLLLLNSPARNPDGWSLDEADRAVVEARLAAGVRVVVNETYREWQPTAARVAGAEIVGSLHKVAGVGARLGYVAGPRFGAESVRHLAATEPPLTWQRGWALFLERGGLDLLAATGVAGSAAAAAGYDTALAELSGPPPRPAVGPHRLLPLPAGTSEEDALRRLAAAGYRAVGGAHFAAPGPALRFCFLGVPAEAAAELPSRLQRLGLLPEAAR